MFSVHEHHLTGVEVPNKKTAELDYSKNVEITVLSSKDSLVFSVNSKKVIDYYLSLGMITPISTLEFFNQYL